MRGDPVLAEAYAVNVDSAWRHYAARIAVPHQDKQGIDHLNALLEDRRHDEHFWRLSAAPGGAPGLRCGAKWVKVDRSGGHASTAATMFLGEFEHTLDEKNRLTLPAKFRDSFPDGLVVTRGMDGCLYAYARPDWERLVDSRLADLDLLSRDDRMMQRYFFSAAVEATPDKQGRIMLPAPLVEHGKLGREVVVAGVHDHLEIWNRAAWRTLVEEVEGRAEHVAERLAAKRD